MTWFLFILTILSNGSIQVTATPFPSEQACETAKTVVLKYADDVNAATCEVWVEA